MRIREEKSTNKWVLVAIVAAAIAALTTAILFIFKQVKKRRAFYAYNDALDYDLDDDDFCYDDDDDFAIEVVMNDEDEEQDDTDQDK